MSTALILLAILIPTAPGAREGDLIRHTTAEYLSAQEKAWTYAPTDIGQKRQQSCRRAIGRHPAHILQQCYLDVSASSRTSCIRTDECESLLDKMDQYGRFWLSHVVCVYD